MGESLRGPVLASVGLILVAVVAALLVTRCIGSGGGPSVERVPAPIPPVARAVVLVPFDDFPAVTADALIDYYDQRYGLAVRLADRLAIPAGAMDPARGQLIGEALLDALAASDVVRGDPSAVVIGLTDEDLYLAGRDWAYAYGVRSTGTLAVVSSRRMADGFADADRQLTRLRKMVTKDIGILYYGLPQSDDPSSVLYGNILGPRDLDRMGEDF